MLTALLLASLLSSPCTPDPVMCDDNYISAPSTVTIRAHNPTATCGSDTITAYINADSTTITYGTGWCASSGPTCTSNKANACTSLAEQLNAVPGVKRAYCTASNYTVTVIPNPETVHFFNLATSDAGCAAVSNRSSGGTHQIGQTILSEGGDGVLTFYKLNGTTKAALTFATHTGANGGTIDNASNNVWKLTENGEDLTLTFATDSLTLASTTGALFTLTPATAITGDLTLNGGAGALTFGAASSSVVVPNNSATALVLGGSGLTNLMTVDTQTDNQKIMITGTTAKTALHVDVGRALFDENVTVSGTLDVSALSGTGATGVGLTASSSAGQACNTTCGASTCLAGLDQTGPVFVACDSAAADTCLCMP